MDEIKTAAARESVSALVDGDWHDQAVAGALDALLDDPQLVQTWHAYQVVGDVLRSAELAPSRSDLAFLDRLEQRLALEPRAPHVLSPERVSGAGRDIPSLSPVSLDRPAANLAVFRWKMLATAACVALVGVVGLQLWSLGGSRSEPEMAAARPAAVPPTPDVVVADSAAGSMLRDPRLDELMAAHRQLGGHSALQVPAGFLRNATYEGAGR
jgi:sigma-E factor negative regulatory protein RseA